MRKDTAVFATFAKQNQEVCVHTHTNRQAQTDSDRQTDRQIDKQTGRQIDRVQTDSAQTGRLHIARVQADRV